MIDVRVKIFLKSLGEALAAILLVVALILGVIGGVWVIFNIPVGFSFAIIAFSIIGGLIYHQYKDKSFQLKYLEKRIKEAEQEIFRLEDKIIEMSNETDVNEIDLQYWNNVLTDARDTHKHLIQERRDLWRWNA